MADTYKGLTVKLGADTSSLSSALRKTKSEVSGVSTELRKIDKALKLDPGNVNLLAQQQKDYRKQIDSTVKQLDFLKQAEKELEEVDTFTPEQEAQWTKLQSEIVMTEQKLKGYKQALADSIIQQGAASSALGKVGSAIEGFGSHVQGFGRGMETVGNGLTSTLTPAILGAGAATVAAAVNIDTALTGVKKTVDGTDEQYQQLKQSAIEFSQTNAVSASQILDIQALGAQLGFTIDELDEFGRVVSGLDIATNMDAETAATEMAQFANITKMSHEDISSFGSAIVGLGNNFATTEADISAMAMRLAASGTQVGMSQADILGLATALSSMGVEAEAGGTAISTIMAQIDKDIALNSDSVQTWALTTGMSAQEFSAAWKNDPVQALSALLSNMEATTAEGGNMSVMLEELGIDGIRQADVMKRLAGNSEFVAKAVAKSNEEWTKNTALQNEVDNRNQSLAAQFEILKNRVIAIADEVGGPLAEALLDIVDQAEPLIKMIADGAKQFSEMSKGEQQAVLQAVALSAALGPMLSLFGKGIKSIEPFGAGLQKIAKFFAEVDFKTSGASKALKNYTVDTKASETAVKKQTDTIKKSSVAMGAAKSAAIGLAMAGIALVIDQVAKYIDHQAKLDKATNGLKGSIGAMNDAFLKSRDATYQASDASEKHVKSLSEVRSEVDKAISKQAELADSIKETFSEAGTNIGMLESYKKTIDELAGKSGLSAQKQAELRLAVKGVNDMCGESYEVVEGFGGSYNVVKEGATNAKDAILELIDAQELQIRAAANNEAYTNSYKNIAETSAAAADATAAYNDVMSQHDEKIKKIIDMGGDYAHALQVVTGEENGARNAMNDANEAYDAAKDSLSVLKDQEILFAQAQSEAASGISKYVASNEFLLASLQRSGKSCLDFTSTLEGVGASVTDLGKLNEEQLSTLASKYDGTYSSISGLLSSYGVNVDSAKVKTQNAFDGMKRSMNLYSDEVKMALFNAGMSADDFVGKLAAAGVSTESFQSLSAEQLALLVSTYDGNIDATKAKLDEFVQKNGEAGTNGASNFASSLSAGAAQAVIAASDVTGQTLAQFEASCSQYGIKGDAAVTAYANALANGATPAAAAAIAMGTSGASGADQSAMFDVSAQSNLFAFNSKIGAAEGTKEAGASAASAGASGAGSQRAMFVGAGVDMLSAFNGIVSNAAGSRTAGTRPANEAASGMKSQNGNARGWGNHLVQNFASGISGMVSWAASAASSVANAVANILGHSVPKEGPLRNSGKGEKEWGEHTVQNYAAGVEKQIPALKKTMGKVALVAADGFKSGSAPSMAMMAAREAKSQAVRVIVDGKSDGNRPINNYFGDISIEAKNLKDVQTAADFANALIKEGRKR